MVLKLYNYSITDFKWCDRCSNRANKNRFFALNVFCMSKRLTLCCNFHFVNVRVIIVLHAFAVVVVVKNKK